MFSKKNDLVDFLMWNTFIEGNRSEVISAMLEKLLAHFKCDRALISLIDKTRLLPLYSIALPKDIAEAKELALEEIPCGLVVNAGEFVHIPDCSSLQEAPLKDFFGKIGSVSYLGHPLHTSESGLMGVLGLFADKTTKVTARDADLFAIFACRLSLEVENERLHSKVAKLKEAIEKYTVTDRTTGIYKRSFLHEKLEIEFRRAKRYNRPLSCVLFGLDNYQPIMEKYGTNLTNCLMKEISRLLKGWVREIDLIFRYSNAEFFLILPETDMEHAYILAERIKIRLQEMQFPIQDMIRDNETIAFTDKVKNSDEDLMVKIKMGLSSYPNSKITNALELITLSDNILTQNRGSEDNYLN